MIIVPLRGDFELSTLMKDRQTAAELWSNGFSKEVLCTLGGVKKMAGLLHRTAATTYPCCLPALGEFSRSWPCKTCRGKDN